MRTFVAISTALILGSTLSACNRELAQAPHQQTQTVPAAPEVTPIPETDVTTPPVENSATPPPAQDGNSVTKFRAVGTEPFWAFDIDGDTAKYMTPENQAGVTFKVTRSASAKGVDYSGTMNGKPVALTITTGTCSDGMSDKSYEFTVKATVDGRTLRGCAERGTTTLPK